MCVGPSVSRSSLRGIGCYVFVGASISFCFSDIDELLWTATCMGFDCVHRRVSALYSLPDRLCWSSWALARLCNPLGMVDAASA